MTDPREQKYPLASLLVTENRHQDVHNKISDFHPTKRLPAKFLHTNKGHSTLTCHPDGLLLNITFAERCAYRQVP